MKQLSSFMAMNVSGGDRIAYTYDLIDDATGEVIDSNRKESFFVVDGTLRGHVEAIRDFIRDNKLTE